MNLQPRVRRGVSLVEVLVVIGIIAVLLGLLLAGIQKTREAAALLHNKNNLRQIILAVQQVSSENEGKVENLATSSMPGVATLADRALFARLIPYVQGQPVYHANMSIEEIMNAARPDVKAYRNPSDPTLDPTLNAPALAPLRGKCSYACNMMAFDGSVRLVASIPDGASHTIAFGDRYFYKASSASTGSYSINLYHVLFDPVNGEICGDRRPTFADRGWKDVLPVTDPTTRKTRASVPGMTFQVRPRFEDVDHHVLQTPHRAGLTVAMFDGSVRTVAPAVDESVFWSQVTPAGGESLTSD